MHVLANLEIYEQNIPELVLLAGTAAGLPAEFGFVSLAAGDPNRTNGESTRDEDLLKTDSNCAI